MPLILVRTKVPKKTPTLRDEQSDPWISTPLSLKWRERNFPFYIPLTGAHKCAKKTPLLRGERSGVLQMAVAIHLSIAFQQSIWNFTFHFFKFIFYFLLGVASGVLHPALGCKILVLILRLVLGNSGSNLQLISSCQSRPAFEAY